MTKLQKRFLSAVKGGANAAQIDALLADVKAEQKLRRLVEEIAEREVGSRELAIALDVMQGVCRGGS